MTIVSDRPLFENEEWAVIAVGLEHKRTGYFIAREEIAGRRSDGLWMWPVHLAEKTWCSMPAFSEAFESALAAYGVAADADLARSFQLADSPAMNHSTADEREGAVTPAPGLRENVGIPISREPARTSRTVSGSGRPASFSQDRLRSREPAPGYALSATARARLSRPGLLRATRWRASRRIRIAGNQIVRLLRAAWSIG